MSEGRGRRRKRGEYVETSLNEEERAEASRQEPPSRRAKIKENDDEGDDALGCEVAFDDKQGETPRGLAPDRHQLQDRHRRYRGAKSTSATVAATTTRVVLNTERTRSRSRSFSRSPRRRHSSSRSRSRSNSRSRSRKSSPIRRSRSRSRSPRSEEDEEDRMEVEKQEQQQKQQKQKPLTALTAAITGSTSSTKTTATPKPVDGASALRLRSFIYYKVPLSERPHGMCMVHSDVHEANLVFTSQRYGSPFMTNAALATIAKLLPQQDFFQSQGHMLDVMRSLFDLGKYTVIFTVHITYDSDDNRYRIEIQCLDRELNNNRPAAAVPPAPNPMKTNRTVIVSSISESHFHDLVLQHQLPEHGETLRATITELEFQRKSAAFMRGRNNIIIEGLRRFGAQRRAAKIKTTAAVQSVSTADPTPASSHGADAAVSNATTTTMVMYDHTDPYDEDNEWRVEEDQEERDVEILEVNEPKTIAKENRQQPPPPMEDDIDFKLDMPLDALVGSGSSNLLIKKRTW